MVGMHFHPILSRTASLWAIRSAQVTCHRAHLGHSFATEYQKSIDAGVDPPSSAVDVGWLWDKSMTTTKRKLDHLSIRPKKSLGQNFVTDEDILRAIAAASKIAPGEPVIEFGPGTGNLTKHLLDLKADITAIEKDDMLQERLKQEFPSGSLRVIHGDVMLLNMREIVSEILTNHPEKRRIKIISNLPYNITTECLKLYLPMGDIISNLFFMIQEEVATRLCYEEARKPDYRAMSVYVRHFCDPQYLFKIDKAAYFPEPQVDGALVNFKLKMPHKRTNVEIESKFLSFVSKAFSSRRKKLANSLRPMYDPDVVMNVLQTLDLSANTRAQELMYDEFVTVFNSLESADKRTPESL